MTPIERPNVRLSKNESNASVAQIIALVGLIAQQSAAITNDFLIV